MKTLLAITVMFAVVASAADPWRLPPETVKFKQAPGVQLVNGNCTLCHSADYIATQPRMSRAAWKATVEKMRTKYGAPVATNSVDGITDYLVREYGIPTK